MMSNSKAAKQLGPNFPQLELGASVYCYICHEPHLIAELDNSQPNGPEYYFCPKGMLGGEHAIFINWSSDDAIKYKIETQNGKAWYAEIDREDRK